MFVLEERGKPEYGRKTSRSRVENQQTQPTYDAESGNRTRATLVGGECSTNKLMYRIPKQFHPSQNSFHCSCIQHNKSTRQKGRSPFAAFHMLVVVGQSAEHGKCMHKFTENASC